MSEQHKTEPNKIAAKPGDAGKSAPNKPHDGAGKPDHSKADGDKPIPAKKPLPSPAHSKL